MSKYMSTRQLHKNVNGSKYHFKWLSKYLSTNIYQHLRSMIICLLDISPEKNKKVWSDKLETRHVATLNPLFSES